MLALRYLFQVILISLCLKVLLIPSYRSTDFEVHRNWMAITSSLPISQWYFDQTSQWTLDYPPMFAYFERLLSIPAYYFDPNMLNVNNLNYASFETVLFQRLSVIVSELVLLGAVCLWALNTADGGRMVTLVAFNAGLLFVDHMHFQYNGLLLGLLVGCMYAAREHYSYLLAFLFTLLVLMKHLFAPLAPLVAIILLKHCIGPGKKFDFVRAMLIFLIVIGVVVAALSPILLNTSHPVSQMEQLFLRLFPFGRGLVHAYWAPNVWALYYFADKCLSYFSRRFLGVALGVSEDGVALANSASGLVGDYALHVLPRISPAICLFLVLLSNLPAMYAVWRKNDVNTLVNSFAFVTLSSFMVGYHVHEKAILVPAVLYCLLPMPSSNDVAFFMVLAGVSTVSLFPLIFGKIEWFVKVFASIGYLSICWHSFRCSKLTSLERVVIVGVYTVLFLCVLYADFVHPLLFTGPDGVMTLPFFPLMQLSVVCSLLLLRPWGYAFLRLLGTQ